MEHAAQAVGNGMTHPQPRMGESDARHGGSQVHPQPHLPAPGVGGRQHRVGNAEALPGIHIRKHAGPGGHIGLHGVGQHIKAGIRDQPRRQPVQQVAVQNGGVGPQLGVHQGMLGLSVGQDRKVRDLRAGAGGSGDGHQREVPLGKIGHGLGAVHGAAASQGHQQVRLELLQLCRALGGQGHRGVGLHGVKIFHLLRARQLCDPLRRAVLHEIGIRHQQQPPGPEALQRRHRPRARVYFCC